MLEDSNFKSEIFTWLKSIIKCELLGTTITCDHVNLRKPLYSSNIGNLRTWNTLFVPILLNAINYT